MQPRRNFVQDRTPVAAQAVKVMAVGDFDTKVAVAVHSDLAAWQRLNVCAFLVSGVVASADRAAIGEDYVDADRNDYLPLLVQPVLVFQASSQTGPRFAPSAARTSI
jgi:hypothetical protein